MVGIDFARLRGQMVDRQIRARGVNSKPVLAAMRRIPREKFIPEDLHPMAYHDSPLPIGACQTISQPYIVALMIDSLELQGGEKVLEIGTGSGYAAAVLAEIAGEVYTIERVDELATNAAALLADCGYTNVTVVRGDGTLGLPEQAPFDAIVVTAGAPDIPESLQRQLKIGGRLVIPVGRHRDLQELLRVTRISEAQFECEDLTAVRFVPLVGEEGWHSR